MADALPGSVPVALLYSFFVDHFVSGMAAGAVEGQPLAPENGEARTYVLIPGADGRASYWDRVAPILRERGRGVVAVDLPVTDPAAGFEEYVWAVVEAVGGRRDGLTLVAQSLGGFIAPVAAERLPARAIILLNAMVPAPGESANDWWTNTGQAEARAAHYASEGLDLPAEFDPLEAFFHDVPPEVVQQAMAAGQQHVRFDTLFQQPWPLTSWPRIPTRFLQGRDDRLFPLEFQRRVVSERLGVTVEEMPGGHLVALSRPKELADRLER
jgi:pimeloyl-ACP methyl ester carboxylesterase